MIESPLPREPPEDGAQISIAGTVSKTTVSCQTVEDGSRFKLDETKRYGFNPVRLALGYRSQPRKPGSIRFGSHATRFRLRLRSEIVHQTIAEKDWND
jgi:hypothetical protein